MSDVKQRLDIRVYRVLVRGDLFVPLILLIQFFTSTSKWSQSKVSHSRDLKRAQGSPASSPFPPRCSFLVPRLPVILTTYSYHEDHKRLCLATGPPTRPSTSPTLLYCQRPFNIPSPPRRPPEPSFSHQKRSRKRCAHGANANRYAPLRLKMGSRR